MNRIRLLALACLTLAAGHAATKYVAPSGDDANDGNSRSTPYRTIAKGLQEIGPGGRLYLGGGTYAEAILNTIPSGSAGAPTVVTNFADEIVTLSPGANAPRVLEFSGTASWITVAGSGHGQIVLDGTHVTNNVVKFSSLGAHGGGDWPSHIRLERLEMKGSPQSAILGYPRHCEFIHLEVHHAGSSVFDHGMYIEGSDNLIDGCDIHDNYARGIQIFMTGKKADREFASRNTIRFCRIHHNGLTPGNLKPGIDADSGSGNRICDNLIYANGQFGVMVQIGGAANAISHNTFYGNGTAAIMVNTSAAAGSVLENNLAWENGRGPQLVDQRGDSTGTRKLLEPATSPFLSTDPTSSDFLKLAPHPTLPADCGARLP